MAYSWTALPSVASAAVREDIKAKCNAFASKQGHGGYGFTYTVSAGQTISAVHWQELKNAIDYHHNSNICAAFYGAYDIGYDGSQLTAYQGTFNNGVLSVQYNTVYNGWYSIYYSSDLYDQGG